MSIFDDRQALRRDVFMRIAHDLSDLGTCDRKQVGAVIVRDGRCISWGVNGAPPGLPHCYQALHGYRDEADEFYLRNDIYGHTREMEEKWVEGKPCKNATHAEANALAFAARQGISTDLAELYVTVSPCEVCARLIIAAGIVRVIADEEYRDDAGIRLLQEANLGIIVAGQARG